MKDEVVIKYSQIFEDFEHKGNLIIDMEKFLAKTLELSKDGKVTITIKIEEE